MSRFALCAVAAVFALLCSLPAHADWARYGTFKIVVELRRMNAPDLPTEVLQWLHAETRSPEWQGALDIKAQGGLWAYRVRLRVAADGSTGFERITAASATIRGNPVGDFERSSFYYNKSFYFANWADLVSAFAPGANVRFTVAVDGRARSGTIVIQPYSEADFPEVSASSPDGATLVVAMNQSDQWNAVSVWTLAGHSREYVLEDEPVEGFGSAVRVAVPTDGRRPDATYVYECEAGNEEGYGLSYRTVAYGTLVEGSDLDEAGGEQDFEESVEKAAERLMSCMLSPSVGLSLDALLLPAMAAALWWGRRTRR